MIADAAIAVFDLDKEAYYDEGDPVLVVKVLENTEVYVDTFVRSNRELFLQWFQGSSPITFPDSLGAVIPKNGFVLLRVHYLPTSTEQADISSINFFYSKIPVTRPVVSIPLGSLGGIVEVKPKLTIPPDSVKTFFIKTFMPADYSLLYFVPHIGPFGKNLRAYCVTLNNDTIPLIKVDNWDPQFHNYYRFEHPIKLEIGTSLYIEATLDNTINNKRNPFVPPNNIEEGPYNYQEMLSFVLLVVPYEKGDEKLNYQGNFKGKNK